MAKFVYNRFISLFLCELTRPSFIWDCGNESKNYEKHRVSIADVESCFLDISMLILGTQVSPQCDESRYAIIAKNSSGQVLFCCFTLRELQIRVISSRIASRKEREFYEN